MLYNHNIQHAIHTDNRNSKKQSRLRVALAGTGIAGALLLGGLFGSHAGHPAAQSQASTVRASSVISSAAFATQAKTVPMSYTMANDYVGMARQAAIDAGISPDAFVRQIQQESGFNPNAGSPAGAEGIAQFMPGTAASMGVNPYDPSSALPGAARMMASLAAQFGGDYSKALAAYNAGSGAVQSAVAQGGANWLAYMPAETQNYVAIIMG
jgi:soluble lytic murein transglycosylase-like protein